METDECGFLIIRVMQWTADSFCFACRAPVDFRLSFLSSSPWAWFVATGKPLHLVAD